MKSLAVLAALFCALSPMAARADDRSERERTVADIDAFVRQALAEVGAAPGLALAVVEGDQVVMTAGYGVTSIDNPRPVDADTGFYIASSTKSFTALAIAVMAARGEVEVDQPIARWFPASGLPDAIARSTSLTDLLSHRSGLQNEAMTFRAAYSGDSAPASMQALLPDTGAGDTPHGVFDYSNTGYNLATTLLEKRTGGDWRVMVDETVLAPAGMTHTTAWMSRAAATGVVAVGHFADTDDGPTVSPLQKVDATMHSAGGLVSTANDMARWLELQLNDGVIDGRRIFPAGLIASTHQPLVSQDRAFGAYRRDGYGLGWQLGLYGDDRLVHHLGNFAGSRAHVSFMPERRIGVAVMVNEDPVAGELADVVANYVYDRLAGRPDTAARAALSELVTRRDGRRAGLAAARAQRAARPWRLSRPVASYAGTYVSPTMGTMQVAAIDGRLNVRIGVLDAIAEPYDEVDTVRLELVPFRGQTIHFVDRDLLIFDGGEFRRPPHPIP